MNEKRFATWKRKYKTIKYNNNRIVIIQGIICIPLVFLVCLL